MGPFPGFVGNTFVDDKRERALHLRIDPENLLAYWSNVEVWVEHWHTKADGHFRDLREMSVKLVMILPGIGKHCHWESTFDGPVSDIDDGSLVCASCSSQPPRISTEQDDYHSWSHSETLA